MKVRFHSYARERGFRSAKDFVSYAEKEANRFAKLESENPAAYEAFGAAIAGNWRGAAGQAQHSGDTDELSAQLSRAPVFAFSSELTRTLFKMLDQGRGSAARQLVPFLRATPDGSNVHLTAQQANARSEFFAALALEERERPGSRYSSFDEMMREQEDRLSSMLDDDRDEIEARRTEFAEMILEARNDFDELRAKTANLIAEGKAQWLKTHNDYLEQLTTETAVKLWSDRSDLHGKRRISHRRWAVGVGVFGLFAVFIWIFAGFAAARSVFENDSTAQLAAYTASSVALFTLYIWTLRVLIRSMMSEDHLQTDASARSALAHTYLALTKQEAATEKDRAIVLAALFAPVADGLVKDDGMPILSPMAMAAHTFTNPKP